DAEDLELYDFPLPDAILAQLIDKLQQYQPSVIGLNILRKKSEKSTQYPGGEQDFVNHLKMNKNLITVCQFGNSLKESYPPLEPAPKEWVGFSDFIPDKFPPQTPTIRRLLLTRTDNKIVTPSHCNSEYSFAFFLAYQYLARQGISVEPVGENWKFGSSVAKPIKVRTVGYQNLDASGNQLLIRYRHTPSPSAIAQQVTVREVLTDSPSFDPGWVKDRIVIIGVTSILDGGEENTPYGRIPRLHIQAHAVSQILSAVDGDRPFFWWWPQWGNTLWIFIWSLMGSLIVLILKEAFYKWLGIIGVMGILYSVCRFALTQGGWIPLIPAGLALVLSALGLLFYHQIKQSFINPSKN
ncbi:MAG: CHASE2 domain-containing protein, partial [Planktothrix sp.]